MWTELHAQLDAAKQELGIFLRNAKAGCMDVEKLTRLATTVKELSAEYSKRAIFRNMTIDRDDGIYPISADNFAELRELREEGNRAFMSNRYGSIARSWDAHLSCYKYFDIYKEVETDWRGNALCIYV